MKMTLTLLLAATMLVPSVATAQNREIARERQDLREERRDLRDARQDYRQDVRRDVREDRRDRARTGSGRGITTTCC